MCLDGCVAIVIVISELNSFRIEVLCSAASVEMMNLNGVKVGVFGFVVIIFSIFPMKSSGISSAEQ